MIAELNIAENKLARSDLPIDLDENFEVNTTGKSMRLKSLKKQNDVSTLPKVNKSKAKEKVNKIEKPQTERPSLLKKIKETKPEDMILERMDEGGETEILDDYYIPNLVLECDSPRGTHQIEIATDHFKIGKSTDGDVDAMISFNNAISRVHCLITFDDDCYYIEDLGSANGTFHNRSKIDDGKYHIVPGDEIRLANLVFTVKKR